MSLAAELMLAATLARRELRGGFRGMRVLLACIAIGVAAVTAVGLLNASVQDSVRRDARVLLGGDVVLENPNMPIAPEELREVVPPGSTLSAVVRTNATVTGPDGRHLVVALKAVDAPYPLLGEVRLSPALPLDQALADDGVIVEETLLGRLGVKVGDRLQLGALSTRIAAVLVSEPDQFGGYFTIGPRLMTAQATLDRAGVLMAGALANYDYRLLLPPDLGPTQFMEAVRPAWSDGSWRMRSANEAQPGIARFTDRLAGYLTLAGLAALLVGGLGVALSIAGHLSARTTTIATMRSIGATSSQIVAIYLLQIIALAAVGTVLGLLLGSAIPPLVARTVSGLLPVQVETGLFAVPLLLAAGCGMLTALAFALWPLGRAREVAAAGLFRAMIEPGRRFPRASFLIASGVSLLLLVGVAALAVDRPILAITAAAIGLAAALLLTVLARLVLKVLAAAGRFLPFAFRIGAANISRPGSEAGAVLVAMGAGLAVLTTLAVVESVLGGEIAARVPERAPSFIAIDIQPDQRQTFEQVVGDTPGAVILQAVPTVRARIVRIKGVGVDQAPIAERARWTVDRDRGLSWSAAMPKGSELAAGAWWPADYAGPALVSVEDDIAEGYGIGVGDSLHFNILGRIVEAKVASLRREIDWGSGRLDFVFILSPGIIDKAPHTVIAAVNMPPEEAGLFTDRLAKALPNVTPIAVGTIVQQVTDALEKIAMAVRVVASVTLLTGGLVLAGAVLAARRRQLQQTVILKVLGARRIDVLRILLVEYGALGLGAALLGILVGLAGSWAALRLALDLPWRPDPVAMLVTVAIALVMTLLVSGIGVWRLLSQSAATALRSG